MPRDGAIIFSDLIGKLDILRVTCSQCERDGCYGLSRLIDKRAVMVSSSIGLMNSQLSARRKLRAT